MGGWWSVVGGTVHGIIRREFREKHGWLLCHIGWEAAEPWEGGLWTWVGWVERGGSSLAG